MPHYGDLKFSRSERNPIPEKMKVAVGRNSIIKIGIILKGLGDDEYEK